MKLILGCPTLRRYDLLIGMLQSAAVGSRAPDTYYVVDNGGGLQPSDALRALSVVVDAPGENLGCARSWNAMAKKLLVDDDSALLLVGDDILLMPDTAYAMLSEMERGVDFVTTAAGGFSCFMVRKRLFDKIGYFDEQFWPAYFEDNDFHRRMGLHGGVVETKAQTNFAHVNKGSQTVASFTRLERIEHNIRFEANRDRYVAKWGGLPHEEKFDEPYNGMTSD